MRARWIDQAVLGLVVMLFSAAAVRAQEKPQDTAAPAQAKPPETEAAKQAQKEPEAPKPGRFRRLPRKNRSISVVSRASRLRAW